MTELRHRLRRLLRFLSRRRRAFAALLTGLVVLSALHVLAPAAAPTTTVVVARRDVAAGTTVESSDVRAVRLPTDVVPATAVHAASMVVGRATAGPIAADELITDGRLVGAALVSGLGPDKVAAPVRLADADAVRLLQVGDRIDVYAPTAHGPVAQVVVSSALVATLPDRASDLGDNGQGGGVDVRAGGALVVLAVGTGDAARLAQEASRSPLTFSLIG